MAYVPPTSEEFIIRYPAFASVDPETIDYWLAEAAIVCANFPEDYRARAEMSYAAHAMASNGTLGGVTSSSGVTSFRSADFAVSFDASFASRTGFASTPYGQEFQALKRLLFGMPLPAWTPPAHA